LLGHMEKPKESLIRYRKIIKHPCEILCQACAYLKYLAGLYKSRLKEATVEGMGVIPEAAIRIMTQVQVHDIEYDLLEC